MRKLTLPFCSSNTQESSPGPRLDSTEMLTLLTGEQVIWPENVNKRDQALPVICHMAACAEKRCLRTRTPPPPLMSEAGGRAEPEAIKAKELIPPLII